MSIFSNYQSNPKRILIVSPPYRLSQSGFPLGLMYIAATLEKAGHHVEVIDMDVINLPIDDYIKELKERDYDYFCAGGMITCWNFLALSCNLVKQFKPHAKAIIGGGIISSTPLSFIQNSAADIGVIGEGEETILDILHAYENNRPLDSVAGIVYRNELGKAIQTIQRPTLADLDQIPFPAWELFNVDKTYCRFPSHHSFFKAKRVASIYTTRGCPFRCTFCYTEKAVRQRSIDNIMEELKELKDRYKVKYINIADDLFVVRKTRTIEFCEAMIKNKMNLSWSATGRCNIIDKEFLKLMKAAGCEFMGLGIESGSATVLKQIKKAQTPEQIVEAVKMVQQAGITPGGTFILGLPPETKETIRETVATYKEINKYRTHVNRFFYATPYPGTELYDQMLTEGKIGNEIKYFEKISERGDAVDFCVNCTSSMTDEELIRMKREVEAEVFSDFMSKHPWYAFQQALSEKTAWSKIQTLLVTLKMHGLGEAIAFLWNKLLIKLKIRPNVHQRQNWSLHKKTYWQETLFEGHMPTF